MKRMQVDRITDGKLIARLNAELDRLFGLELLSRIDAEKALQQSIEQNLPPALGGDAPGRQDGFNVGVAQQSVDSLVNSSMQYIVQSAMHSPMLSQFMYRSFKESPPSNLQMRVENYHKQLVSGRADLLGQADEAALTEARRRAIDRSLGRQAKAAQGEASATEQIDVGMHAPSALLAPRPWRNGKLVGNRVRRLPTMEKSNRFATAPFDASSRIVVDGKLDDWNGIAPIGLDPVLEGKNPGSVKAPVQKVWIAWSSSGLLIAVDVIDTTGKLENDRPLEEFWKNDSIEVFIDTLDTKFSKRTEAHTHQFFAFPFGHATDSESGGYELLISKQGTKRIAYPANVIRRVAQRTPKGWSMELLIPKELLSREDIESGRVVGFNLQINTGSDTCHYFTYQKKLTPSTHPEIWGDLQLLGTDAFLSVLDDAGERLETVCPGRPIRVRVVDPDMNADDQKCDRVSVIIRTEAGEVETLLLKETGPSTGVFEAEMQTRLSTGNHFPGVLSLFEGERVSVIYVDQAQAFGERDVTLKMNVAVGLLGKAVGAR